MGCELRGRDTGHAPLQTIVVAVAAVVVLSLLTQILLSEIKSCGCAFQTGTSSELFFRHFRF